MRQRYGVLAFCCHGLRRRERLSTRQVFVYRVPVFPLDNQG
jgi:hypothetical protein